jgi:ketosteroid isomerase-like protein
MTTDEITIIEIERCVEKLRLAMLEPTHAALDALAADNLSYGHSSGMVENKASFIDALVSGCSDFRRIALTDQIVTASGNVALVRHNLEADTFDGGRPGHVSLKILLVWQQRHGEWKLLARQAVRAPA